MEIDTKRHVTDAFDVVKANLVPCVVFAVASMIPVLGWIATVNFLAAVKANKDAGKAIGIGELFDFENVADKAIVPFAVGIALSFCLVPGALVLFAPCIVADRPGTPFVDALKGAFAFGKANLVPCIVFTVLLGALVMIASMLCFVPVLLAVPTAVAASYFAYDEHKASLEASAAEAGVQL